MNQEITLNFLVDYFGKGIKSYNIIKSKLHDKFNLDILETCNSKNFKYFKNIFEYFIDRVGIRKYSLKNKKYNISLLYSLLHCLDDDFCTFEEYKKDYTIKFLKNKIKDDVISKKVKINLPKKMIITRMNQNNIETIDIYIFACYFNINIFIFDFEINKISLYYKEEEYIPHKLNIFISKYKDLYQPLTYKNDNFRYFKYNSTILETILLKKKINIYSIKDKKFKINRDFNKILEKYNNINLDKVIISLGDKENIILTKILYSESEDSDDTISSEFELEFGNLSEDINKHIIDVNSEVIKELKGFTKSKLSKLKKSILLDYLTKLEENNLDNYKTKKSIIERINYYIEKSI